MSEEEHEYRRKNDVTVTKLQATLDAFIERYDHDTQLQNVEIAKIIVTIQSHDEFIRDIKPLYTKGMIAVGAFVLGSIGIFCKWAWNHVSLR